MREDWKEIIESNEADDVKALSRTDILTRVLENQSIWCKSNEKLLQETAASGNSMGSGAIATWSPVLIKMVKRLMPNLVATDFMGTQPLATPDGLIFAMRARYGSQTGPEAFYQEIKSGFSGNGQADEGSVSGFPKDFYATGKPALDPKGGQGMPRSDAENLGTPSKAWAKMALSIEKSSVTALSRGLYADYTHELRQDMMSVHGEDVDSILSDMLVTEIQAEMNREFIRTMNVSAKFGAQLSAKPGLFDLTTDTDGRWFLERLKGFMFQIEIDANAIALDTRRGKGNRILCSPNVASALAMAGLLDYNISNLDGQKNITVDPTGQTFAGVLANGMKVYIDPYADLDYYTIGYKGATELDAGIFFAPYTPLEMYRTVGEDNFNPRMAFKTRYGIVANPFYFQDAAGNVAAGKGLGQQENGYFRKVAVAKLI
ncbi:hypothetical protein [Ralstonia phage RSP15]|uniref:hypothetical protein n=1 Tax=Ralstonia phage RSP15 TaxID=1785960 RepID=UPI00074D3708|nr:hypothetical protein BH754_gp029 [Ralstonia phage RSP15]BAU39987.1 hypothetical protein [Ralstonia phage RSP15]